MTKEWLDTDFEFRTPWFGFYINMTVPSWMFVLDFYRDDNRGSIYWRFGILSGNLWIGLPELKEEDVT